MIRRKNALFANFHGKLAKLKIFHAKCRLFVFNFNFLNNINIYQKQKIFSKKLVPAITDICTGGQQCKYQLLDSGVNISYYLHGGEFVLLLF